MNRTIPTTPALTGHPSALRRSLRHAALVALCAALVALVAASCTTDTLDGRQPDAATDPADVLTFAVSARPAFTEAAVSGQNTAAPVTRAVQTPGATRWEQGDVLWLHVTFYQDKQNPATTRDTAYTSALKYDGAEWRYLTVAEAEDLNTGNLPNFSRLVRWPRGWKDWVDPGMQIGGYYASSGKPDADGTITVNPKGEIPTTPLISGGVELCSPDVQPVPLQFGYNCSRVRIPAGYKVKLIDTHYCSTIGFSLKNYVDVNVEQITEIPEQSEDTDVFLNLYYGSTAKLTRNNVSYTFTFPTITDAEGYSTWVDASYTLTPYTSGAETPGGYDLTIAGEAGLRAFAQAVNAGDRLPNGKPAAEARVLQTANIKLTQEWVPIGKADKPFRGAYNGNGHEITELTITTAPQPDAGNNWSFAGLFGYAGGAVLTGIRLREVWINIPQGSDTDLYVGSVAGLIYNSTLSLCTADGTVNASGGDAEVYAGGIAGYSWYSTISRCRADVETKAAATKGNAIAYAGGIAGWNGLCNFILSCESGDRAVTAEGNVMACAGGIAGLNDGNTWIAFCRTGKNIVTARSGDNAYAGGLVGENDGILRSCYSRATAEATGTGGKHAGAIVGYTLIGVVGYCYATDAMGQGTSDLVAKPDNIVYNTDPKDGEIFRVMTGYTGKVESITSGDTYYPFTTTYDPTATPAYGIIPRRAVWTKDAWKDGGSDPKFPEIDMEYGGDNNP